MKKVIMVSLFTLITMVSCTKDGGLPTSQTKSTTSTCSGKRTTSVQCSGTTQSGTRCKNMTLSCNGYCNVHGGN